MTNINLLPWREQLREDRKRDFFIALGVVVGIAAVLLFLVDRFFNAGIDNQNARNAFLEGQIELLDTKLTEIRELRNQKEVLTDRMAVIQDLQGTRPVIVRLFDELVRTLPEDVYYSSVRRIGDTIQLEGISETSALVSTLMRRLEASEWFSNPILEEVAAAPLVSDSSTQNDSRRQLFRLSIKATRPEPEQGQD